MPVPQKGFSLRKANSQPVGGKIFSSGKKAAAKEVGDEVLKLLFLVL